MDYAGKIPHLNGELVLAHPQPFELAVCRNHAYCEKRVDAPGNLTGKHGVVGIGIDQGPTQVACIAAQSHLRQFRSHAATRTGGDMTAAAAPAGLVDQPAALRIPGHRLRRQGAERAHVTCNLPALCIVGRPRRRHSGTGYAVGYHIEQRFVVGCMLQARALETGAFSTFAEHAVAARAVQPEELLSGRQILRGQAGNRRNERLVSGARRQRARQHHERNHRCTENRPHRNAPHLPQRQIKLIHPRYRAAQRWWRNPSVGFQPASASGPQDGAPIR